MNDLINFYNITATQTAINWYDNEILLPTIIEFISFFNTKPKILDLGCGTGHESKRLFNQGAEVVGIDFSSKSIEIARNRNPECKFIEMDFFEIDSSFEKFDGILSSGSIIHVPPNNLDTLMMNLYSITNKPGYFEIIFQTGKGNKILKKKIGNEYYERVVYLYDENDIVSNLKDIGFNFIRNGYLHKDLSDNNWTALIFMK